MVGTVAGTIQGESNGTPESMFAVASVIYNRTQYQGFPDSAYDVVNAPNQFTGYSNNPSQTAQNFADAIQNGTLNQYGNTGDALFFQQTGTGLIGNNSYAPSIGGNSFSDLWSGGSPSSEFQAPVYGGTVAGNTYYQQPPDSYSNLNPGYQNAPTYFGQSVTSGSREQVPIGGGISGSPTDGSDPNISITQAYPDSAGVPSFQNPTTDQNLTNYGYFGMQPASGTIGNELPGTTDTSILNANADQLLSGNYAETPTTSTTFDAGGGLTGVINPADNSNTFDPSNAGNYGFFGLSPDNTNSLVTGAASTLGAPNQGSSWWNWLVTVGLDFMERFGLIILGLVLIAGAAWALSREGK